MEPSKVTRLTPEREREIRFRLSDYGDFDISPRTDAQDLLAELDAVRAERDEQVNKWDTLCFQLHGERDAYKAALVKIRAERYRLREECERLKEALVAISTGCTGRSTSAEEYADIVLSLAPSDPGASGEKK